jgi:N-acetyl-D-muramate 6-phosphate phosphatase
MSQSRFPRVVLFDLDGTLLDSAPDMLATVNLLRARHGMVPMPLAGLRPHVSRGSRAMLVAAFPDLDAAQRDAMVPDFLETYLSILGQHSGLFDDVETLLAALEADGARWGIVTNKPEYLAREVLPQLGWEGRCAILIGGDTLAERKPHPLPLQVAAQRLDSTMADCVYVGDDERDIQSARAAGMRSVAALWGYRGDDEDPAAWGADAMLSQPRDLLDPGAWPRLP